MTVSQQISNINNNYYDIDITVTDVPSKFFIVVTHNQLSSGSSTREINIDIMPAEWAPGGTRFANSGMFTRSSNETSVHVTVKKDGTTMAETTTSYS
ncbi:MAG: hypothetical protein AB8H03_25610 [Saprospiraceae bacterium]